MPEAGAGVEYPGLYRAANRASVQAQTRFRIEIASYLVLLIAGAALSLLAKQSQELAIAGAIVFLAGIGVSVYSVVRRHDRIWYNGRAVAESVKTSAWRFMMRAEPYTDESDAAAKANFRNTQRAILQQNMHLAAYLAVPDAAEAIPQSMAHIRAQPVLERLRLYQDLRIDEQRAWYQSKAVAKMRSGRRWFAALIICNFAALVCMLLKIGHPAWEYLTTDVFAVAAGAALTWSQFEKFSDLAAAYNLAAHEIGILRGESENVESDAELCRFVKDAENAFSREHTQWVARKDQ